MQHILHTVLTPQRAAHVYALGLVWLLVIGTLATIVLILVALWAVFALAQLLLAATVESSSAISQTFFQADPFVRVLILAGLTWLGYRLIKRMRRASR